MATRTELAEVWRQAAQTSREDIFGPLDELRPIYSPENRILLDQIDVPAIGMVGSDYCGELAIVSVNGVGGKDHKSLPSSDRMYDAFRMLRSAVPGESALKAFEALNEAVGASIPDWSGIWPRHLRRILTATDSSLKEIAYLYLVPFRTKGDDGSKINRRYLEAAYDQHLIRQLRAVAPKFIVAIDGPSRNAALRFNREASGTEVI